MVLNVDEVLPMGNVNCGDVNDIGGRIFIEEV